MSPVHLTASYHRDLSPLPARVERKFFMTPGRVEDACALLRACCRPDPDYPSAQVNSLYFDTSDLDQHEASDTGSFGKDKVRIRWYGTEHDPHVRTARAIDPASSPAAEPEDDRPHVWLELKSRRGFESTKQRAVIRVPATALAPAALIRGIVPASTLTETVVGFGFFPEGALKPVVAVSYWRDRFVEPRTGYRISVDSRIRSTMIMPGIGRGERGLELPGAVVEVKGATFDLPPALLALSDLGAAWTRYSKYSSSIDGHLADQGAVSRLWPTGVLGSATTAPTPIRRAAQRGTRPLLVGLPGLAHADLPGGPAHAAAPEVADQRNPAGLLSRAVQSDHRPIEQSTTR